MNLPQPKSRPKFAHWRYERNLSLRATADLLERVAGFRICSYEQVRAICRPIDDAGRAEPSDELAAAIATLTGGEVGEGDWPRLAQAA